MAGAPTKYKKEYCQALIDFFTVEPHREVIEITRGKNDYEKETIKEVANDLPLLEKFASSIGVHRDTVQEWAKVHPEFSVATKRAKDLQKNMLVTNAIKGLYNSTFSIFLAKNITDLHDKQQVEHSGRIDRNMSDEELDAIIRRTTGKTSTSTEA